MVIQPEDVFTLDTLDLARGCPHPDIRLEDWMKSHCHVELLSLGRLGAH